MTTLEQQLLNLLEGERRSLESAMRRAHSRIKHQPSDQRPPGAIWGHQPIPQEWLARVAARRSDKDRE